MGEEAEDQDKTMEFKVHFVDETTEPIRVGYVKVRANPGLLTCQRPECEGEPAVKSAEVYSHAWDKHRTNYIRIEPETNQEQQG